MEGVIGSADVTIDKTFDVAVQVGFEVDVTTKSTSLVAADPNEVFKL